MAESKEEPTGLLRVKVKSEKAGLKVNTQQTKIGASIPITFKANRWGKSRNSDKVYFIGL